jgi:site-specific DNA-methyltransferase (adenine-specific)
MEDWLNKVHHGDCLELMESMPEKSIDVVVTSPPYNLRRSTGGGMRNGSGLWKNATLLKGYANGFTDDMPYADYVEWQRKCLTAMMRLLNDKGAIFYNHKWRVQDGLLQDRHDIIEGFPVRQIIIWQRSGGINFNLQYFLPTYEVIYLICKKDFRLTQKDPLRPKAACCLGDVWKINQDFGNDHPAPFPVEIPKRCIESTDAKIVLDPFIGSGTTAIAAKKLGVNWVGMEISEQYCNSSRERIAAWDKEQEEQVAAKIMTSYDNEPIAAIIPRNKKRTSKPHPPVGD